ncbi:alpha/beta-hydrolase [Ramaria rubella]|nr:alpha/beta-hydrolase [Ramaria rubella]
MVLQKQLLTSKDGTEIYAEAAGNPSKPHVVLVHGFGLSTIVFSKQFSDQKLLETLYLVAYDLRGHGRSGKPDVPEAYSQDRNAEDFMAVVNGFNLRKPILAGWSMGASAAADVCHTYGPSPLSGIIYMGGVPWLGREIGKKIGTEMLIKMMGDFAADDLSRFSEVAIRFADISVADPAQMDFTAKMSWIGCLFRLTLPVRRCILSREQDPSRLLQEGGKAIPLLIINGALDAHCKGDVVMEEMKSFFADFEGVVVPEASHAVFWDQPEVVRENFLRFAARVS